MLRRGGAILGFRVLQAGAAAIAGWSVARALGPTGQGRFSLLVLLATAGAAALNGGVGLAAVPDLRRGTIAPRRVRRAQLAWALGAAVAALPPLALLLRHWADLSPLVRDHGLPVLLVPVGVALLGMLLADAMSYDLTALGRVTRPPAVNAARAVAWCAAALLLAHRGAALPLLLSAYAAVHLGGALAMARDVGRGPEPSPRGGTATSPPGIVALALDLWRRGRLGQLSAVISLLHLRLDLAVVAWFHPPAVVGVYSVAVMVGELLWLIPGALQPLLIHAAAGEDPDRSRQTHRALRWALGTTLAAALVLALLAPRLLPRLFGDAYAGAVPALHALLPGVVVFSAGAVLAGEFIGRGHPEWNTWASLVTLVVNVGAGLLLIPPFGAVGAAWASTVAYGLGTLVMLGMWRRADSPNRRST